ncbi:hypothetical protein KSP39_PZI005646 [Platanthera zijinensis]|uniref:Uncharacterized protein n=1 Tax=Platanthera zijinensis TaxID=2320716 RepID=A0AAP0BQY7_9ASPA
MNRKSQHGKHKLTLPPPPPPPPPPRRATSVDNSCLFFTRAVFENPAGRRSGKAEPEEKRLGRFRELQFTPAGVKRRKTVVLPLVSPALARRSARPFSLSLSACHRTCLPPHRNEAQ